MTLLLDAGNSRIKWADLADEASDSGGACPITDVSVLRRAFAEKKRDHAVVSCVAGEAVREALAGVFSEAGISVHWIRSESEGHGLRNHYAPPESLGSDRYAALVGATRRFHRDCVVVNVGTAITADILTGDGQFLGGCIAPGPDLMRKSLYSATAGISPMAGDWQDFPSTTGAGVATGVAQALLGVAQGMRERLAVLRGGEFGVVLPAVVLGGGARQWLRPLLRGEVFEVDELVLEGLAWIARDLGFAA